MLWMITKLERKMSKNRIAFVSIAVLALFLFLVNVAFSMNIYFNGDEGLIMEILVSFADDWNLQKIGSFSWKRTLPLFPLPFLEIFGFNLVGWRIAQASFIALSFVVGYFLARKFFCKITAWIVAVILLVYPGFILYLFNEYPFTIFLISLSLLLFAFWYETKRKVYAFLLFFTLGFGIFTDLVMIYASVSLLLGYLVISFFDDSREIKMNRNWLICLICFLVGISPIVYINLHTNNHQFINLYEGILTPQKENPSYNNLAVFENMGQVFAGLNNILIGEGHQWMGYEKNIANIPLFYLAFLILLWLGNKKDYFLLVFFYSFILLLVFQPQCFKSIHITFVIIPLLIIIARSMTVLIKSRKYKVLGLILFLVFVITNTLSLSISFVKLADQSFVEHQDLRKASFNMIISMKYGEGNVSFGDVLIAKHLMIKYPDSNAYLCKNELNLTLEDLGGIYGYTDGFDCDFENKTDRGVLYIFPTNEFMEGVMGEAYYKRNVSIEDNGKWHYYPFYSFRKHLNETNTSLVLEDEIKNSQGETMFEIYSIFY